MADYIILIGLALLILLAIRSVVRRKKGGCSGNCSCCGSCTKHKKDSE